MLTVLVLLYLNAIAALWHRNQMKQPRNAKNTLSNLGYLAAMLGLGFAIYYFALNPNSPLKNPQSNLDAFSTQAFLTQNYPMKMV